MSINIKMPNKQMVRLTGVDDSTTIGKLKEMLSAGGALMPVKSMKLNIPKKKACLANEITLGDAGVKMGAKLILKGPVMLKVSHNDGSTTVVAASKSRLKMTIGDLKNDIDAASASSADILLKGKILTNETTFKAAGIFTGDTVLHSVMPSNDILVLVSSAINQQALERRIIHALDHLGAEYGLIVANMPAYRPKMMELLKISGKTGVYPQLFKDGQVVGVAEDIMTMHDDEKLATILEIAGK